MNIRSTLTGFAIQENAICKLRNHPGYTEGSRKCRVCEYHGVRDCELEDVCHVVSRCTRKMANLYLLRHNNAVRLLANNILRNYKMETLHYNERPVGIKDNADKNVRLMFDVPYTETCDKMKPDIIVLDDTNARDKRAYIIEVGISWPLSLKRLEVFKYVKYAWNSEITDLDHLNGCTSIDNLSESYVERGANIAHVLGLRGYLTKTIPIIIGTQGEVSDQFMKFLKDCPLGSTNLIRLAGELQRAAVLGSAAAVRAQLACRQKS
uniref:Reverse transcriptase n=1 Tax=Panagrolaimus superbus TaxID=310955 RepID=A0A914ZB73_9BILA